MSAVPLARENYRSYQIDSQVGTMEQTRERMKKATIRDSKQEF